MMIIEEGKKRMKMIGIKGCEEQAALARTLSLTRSIAIKWIKRNYKTELFIVK